MFSPPSTEHIHFAFGNKKASYFRRAYSASSTASGDALSKTIILCPLLVVALLCFLPQVNPLSTPGGTSSLLDEEFLNSAEQLDALLMGAPNPNTAGGGEEELVLEGEMPGGNGNGEETAPESVAEQKQQAEFIRAMGLAEEGEEETKQNNGTTTTSRRDEGRGEGDGEEEGGRTDRWHMHSHNDNNNNGTTVAMAEAEHGEDSERCHPRLDLLFLLDTSGSIERLFREHVRWAVSLVESLPLEADTVRVAAVQYAGFPLTEFALGTYPSAEDIRQHLQRVHSQQGTTRTGYALRKAEAELFRPDRGARADAGKIIVLFTDGLSIDDPTKPAQQLRELKHVKIFVVSVSIGEDASHATELNQIAGRAENLFGPGPDELSRLRAALLTEAERAQACIRIGDQVPFNGPIGGRPLNRIVVDDPVVEALLRGESGGLGGGNLYENGVGGNSVAAVPAAVDEEEEQHELKMTKRRMKEEQQQNGTSSGSFEVGAASDESDESLRALPSELVPAPKETNTSLGGDVKDPGGKALGNDVAGRNVNVNSLEEMELQGMNFAGGSAENEKNSEASAQRPSDLPFGKNGTAELSEEASLEQQLLTPEELILTMALAGNNNSSSGIRKVEADDNAELQSVVVPPGNTTNATRQPPPSSESIEEVGEEDDKEHESSTEQQQRETTIPNHPSTTTATVLILGRDKKGRKEQRKALQQQQRRELALAAQSSQDNTFAEVRRLRPISGRERGDILPRGEPNSSQPTLATSSTSSTVPSSTTTTVVSSFTSSQFEQKQPLRPITGGGISSSEQLQFVMAQQQRQQQQVLPPSAGEQRVVPGRKEEETEEEGEESMEADPTPLPEAINAKSGAQREAAPADLQKTVAELVPERAGEQPPPGASEESAEAVGDGGTPPPSPNRHLLDHHQSHLLPISDSEDDAPRDVVKAALPPGAAIAGVAQQSPEETKLAEGEAMFDEEEEGKGEETEEEEGEAVGEEASRNVQHQKIPVKAEKNPSSVERDDVFEQPNGIASGGLEGPEASDHKVGQQLLSLSASPPQATTTTTKTPNLPATTTTPTPSPTLENSPRTLSVRVELPPALSPIPLREAPTLKEDGEDHTSAPTPRREDEAVLWWTLSAAKKVERAPATSPLPPVTTQRLSSSSTTTKAPTTTIPQPDTIQQQQQKQKQRRAFGVSVVQQHLPPRGGIASGVSCPPVDILFLVDSSGSVFRVYDVQKDWLEEIIRQIGRGEREGGPRVALLQFAGAELQKTEWGWNSFHDAEHMMDAFQRVRHLTGTTYIGRALQQAVHLLEGRQRQVPVFVVLLSDGFSQDDAAQYAQQLRSMPNTQFYALSIAELSNTEYLHRLTDNPSRVFIGPTGADLLRAQLLRRVRCGGPEQ